jgi:hypothetical protein
LPIRIAGSEVVDDKVALIVHVRASTGGWGASKSDEIDRRDGTELGERFGDRRPVDV